VVVPELATLVKHKNFRDLSGHKFNYLTVLAYLGRNYKLKAVYKCLCVCGNYLDVEGQCVKSGHVKSCGCQRTKVCREMMMAIRAKPSYKPNSRPHFTIGEITKTFFSQYVSGAKKRGIEFKLSQEDAAKLFEKQKGRCALTGLPIVARFKSGFRTPTRMGRLSNPTASLDRIDSTKGYELGNVQWVHKDINVSKMSLSQTHYQLNSLLVAHKFQEDLLNQIGWTPLYTSQSEFATQLQA
jgi:hypothetical protein